jgi:hypothetical protein
MAGKRETYIGGGDDIATVIATQPSARRKDSRSPMSHDKEYIKPQARRSSRYKSRYLSFSFILPKSKPGDTKPTFTLAALKTVGNHRLSFGSMSKKIIS